MAFKALIVDKAEDGTVSQSIATIGEDRLPEADVTVAVEYSTLNYKDGLCLTGGGGLVRKYPHVPGIDLAGTVEKSDNAAYRPGDKVVLTGWRVGEAWWGGYAQKARVRAEWLTPLPEGITTRQAMAVGTAGFTAMLAVLKLEDQGVAPGGGEVLVTGGAGGVGSVAIAVLAKLGRQTDAERDLATALELWPDSLYALRSGWIYERSGRLDDAERGYRRALEIAPAHRWTQKQLARIGQQRTSANPASLPGLSLVPN